MANNRMKYVIDVNNKNYLNAIVTCHADMPIETIDEEKVLQGQVNWDNYLKCSDLPSIIEKKNQAGQKPEKIEITCAALSLSTKNIFPKLANFQHIIDNFQPTTLDDIRVDTAVAWVQAFVDGILNQGTNETAIGKPTLPNLNVTQAFLVLNAMQKKFSISGFIHLSVHDVIIFQIQNADIKLKNFCLFYGAEKSTIDKLDLSLNIDNGFEANWPHVRMALQPYFQLWKEGKYQGAIIPDESAGFDPRYFLKRHSAPKFSFNCGRLFCCYKKQEDEEPAYQLMSDSRSGIAR